MKRRIPIEQRHFVAGRAIFKCEYCHLPEQDSLLQFHVEHVRSIKHGGSDAPENLALSCPDGNFYKGSDLGTYLDDQEVFVRFFNPRTDNWRDHFRVSDGVFFSKKLFELFSLRQKGNFSSHTSPFFRPIARTMHLKNGLVCLENLLFLSSAEQLKQLLKLTSVKLRFGFCG